MVRLRRYYLRFAKIRYLLLARGVHYIEQLPRYSYFKFAVFKVKIRKRFIIVCLGIAVSVAQLSGFVSLIGHNLICALNGQIIAVAQPHYIKHTAVFNSRVFLGLNIA